MADQPKTPLKADQSCSNFHRILSFHHIIKLHWSEKLKGDIKNFSFGVWGWSAPLKGGMSNMIQEIMTYLTSPFEGEQTSPTPRN